MNYFVYILISDVPDQFYIGQNSCMQERLIRHNEGEADKFTRRYRPWSVFHLTHCSSRELTKWIVCYEGVLS